MTAFCGPVVPLEKNIITGSSPVTARSVVAGSDGRRSESVCSSFHDIVLTPPVEIDVNSSFTITVYKRRQFNKQFNPFKGTLKPHSNGPLYSITVVGTLAVDGWAVTQRGGAWAGCPPSPLLAVPNVTAHQSTASVLTLYYSMWHCNCFCPLKG